MSTPTITAPSAATVTTVAPLPYINADVYGDRPALRHKVDGTWQDVSYAEVRDTVDEIARGLIALGVKHGDRVALLCESRAEWSQIASGVHATGATVVPIYPSSSADECAWVLANSGAVAIICENDRQADKIDQVIDSLPELDTLAVLDSGAADRLTVAEIRALGSDIDPARVQERVAAVTPNDLAIIIYTSGTTGRPKGCMLSHGNLAYTARVTNMIGFMEDGDVAYIYLPMAHSFAQAAVVSTSAVGGVVAFVSGGGRSIMSDLREVRPHYLPSVPRIYEKVYSAITADLSPEVLEAGIAAHLQLRELSDPSLAKAKTRAAADAIAPALAAANATFGGRLRVGVSGAAPISADILRFFDAAGIRIYEGYGLSETGGVGTLNLPIKTTYGSVGSALPGTAVKIAEDGEILLAGESVFKGYWMNPDATAEMLTEDGWLLSGDLGSMDADGMVYITGRKKELIITAGGKNITPANLQNDLRQLPLVSQAYMYGDRRPYCVALVTLDPETVLPWAKSQGLPTSLAELATEPAVIEAINAGLAEANAKYAPVAQIKKVTILPRDFSQENGEMTPTLKLKRSVIAERYAAELEALYAA